MNETYPLWVLLLASASVGTVAQLGTSLSYGLPKQRERFAGNLLLSLVFSLVATLFTLRLTAIDDLICVAIGVLVGSIPPLITLRAGAKFIGKKYDIDLDELLNNPVDPKLTVVETPTPPPTPGGSP